MKPNPRNESDASSVSFFVQIRAVERRLLRLALESADGDLEVAASLLGIERPFFVARSKILGGVLKGSVVNEPPLMDMALDEDADAEDPGEETPLASTDLLKERIRKSLYGERKPTEPVSSDLMQPASGNAEDESELPEIAGESEDESKTLEKVMEELREQEPDESSSEDEAAKAERLKEEPWPCSKGGEDERLAGREPGKRKPGRPVAVSPYSQYMTSREAEQALGVSAAGLGYMKNRGEVTAIYDENAKIWLYPRDQIETIAAERMKQRKNGASS